ncbi:hemin uptake protein HemP [Yoonia sp. SS1-5]|uniref:Hemin uptake protein HemP n=1 Tax=Yoonia rhodophyticola TaxID=3137370 RepID=A0AAN0MC75_9RHOB
MIAQIAATGPKTQPLRRPSFDARDLVGDDGQANIVLGDQVYVLRITRAGKLILTK